MNWSTCWECEWVGFFLSSSVWVDWIKSKCFAEMYQFNLIFAGEFSFERALFWLGQSISTSPLWWWWDVRGTDALQPCQKPVLWPYQSAGFWWGCADICKTKKDPNRLYFWNLYFVRNFKMREAVFVFVLFLAHETELQNVEFPFQMKVLLFSYVKPLP